ncbi:MAG: hypothetical protein AB7T10_01585 [bacterium]
MKDKNEKLIGIEDLFRDYETPAIDSTEENVMKAIAAKKIKQRPARILIAPIIGYLVSSVLFTIVYSRNAIFSFTWDFTGDRIISFLQGLARALNILSQILPHYRGEYLYVPLAGMLIISVGALAMHKKNKKKGGNR